MIPQKYARESQQAKMMPGFPVATVFTKNSSVAKKADGAPPASPNPTQPTDAQTSKLSASSLDFSALGRDALNADTNILFSTYEIPNNPDMNVESCIPLGFVMTPLQMPATKPPVLRKDPLRCHKCQAYITRYANIHNASGTWSCVFCSYKNRSPGLEQESSLELSFLMVDYMDPVKQPLNKSPPPPLHPTHIFIIDETLSRPQVTCLKDNLLQAVGSLKPRDRVVLITISNIASVLRFDAVSPTACELDVFAGHSLLVDGDITRLTQSRDRYCGAMKDSKDMLVHAISCLRGAAGSDDVRLRRRRCVGVGLDIVSTILKDSQRNPHTEGQMPLSTKVMLFLGGMCNYGPGSISVTPSSTTTEAPSDPESSFYSRVAEQLCQVRASLHVFAAGYARLGLAASLQTTVMQTGGRTLLYNVFDQNHLRDLIVCINGETAQATRLEVVTSAPLYVSHIMGPALTLDSTETIPKQEKLNRTNCVISSVSRDSSYSVYLGTEDVVLADQVYVQVCIHLVTSEGDCVERVFTKELRTTGNVVNFVSSVDTKVAAVLAAKRIALQAYKHSTHEAIKSLIGRVKHIASAFGQFFPNYSGRDVHVVPPELSELVYLLYMMRIGPMLGVLLQHEDNIAALQCLFIHAPPAASLRLLLPDVLMCGPSGSQQYVMCETLALQSDYVLLVDHQTDIFIWSGRNTATPEFDRVRAQCEEFANKVASQRYPCAVIKTFKEGASMARWLQCRMVPSHKDRTDLQPHFFPQIASLTPQQRNELTARLPITDEKSLHQWLWGLDIAIGVYGKLDDEQDAV